LAQSSKVLTDAAARRLKPQRERRTVPDGAMPGLNLIIQSSGHKSFQMRFRGLGKITLGPFDAYGHELAGEPAIGMPLTVAAARQLAAWIHRERALGRNPIADHRAREHRRRAEQEQEQAASNSFAASARIFIDEHARPKTRRWHETAKLLGLRWEDLEPIPGGLAQRWADKPVHEIDSHDIWSSVDEARRIGVPGIVARTPGLSEARPRALFAALSAMFGWLHRHRKIEQNPCTGMHRPSAPKARERVLTPDELRWFWRACDAVGEPFGMVFKLLLLLGQRLNEVAGMSRDELSADGTTWSLPGSRTKNGRPHQVPLPKLAREIIASVKENPGNLIFSTTGATPPSGWSRAKHRLDDTMLAVARMERRDGATIPPFKLHDARRTAITGMSELGVPPHVVEKVANHVSGHQAGVAGVYNKSELMPERREALERWSRHLAGIVAPQPGNIVSLLRKRSK
jgi:integrase